MSSVFPRLPTEPPKPGRKSRPARTAEPEPAASRVGGPARGGEPWRHVPELFVGLGNPGPKYESTRHNAGFWLADRLADRLGAVFRPVGRFSLDACEASTPAGRVRLVKPTTFMNRSGQAVRAIADYYRIEPAAILVVHDELDLPPGTVRFKEGGGHGGHNGLRDIVAHLGSRDFVRVRLGIGRPQHGMDAVDYVLQRPGAEDRRLIDEAIGQVIDWSATLFSGDLQRVMKALHTKRDEAVAPEEGTDDVRGREGNEGRAAENAPPAPSRPAA